MRGSALLRGLILIFGLAIAGYLVNASDTGGNLNEAWIDAKVRGQGVSGAMLFVSIGGLFTALGLPRQIIAFLCGYAFNLALGILLGTLAALVGCVLAFAYARFLRKALLPRRPDGRAAHFDRLVRARPVLMTVLIRLLPVGNNLLTNLAAGTSNIRGRHFFAGTFVGYLPQTLVFALVGSGVHVAPEVKMSLAIALLIVSGVLGTWLYRRSRRHEGFTADPVAADVS